MEKNITETVKDGIGYFNPPLIMHEYEFMESHPDCNFVIKDTNCDDIMVNIVAYATDEKYNHKLTDMYKGKDEFLVITGMNFLGETRL